MGSPRIAALTAIVVGAYIAMAGCSPQYGEYRRGPIPGHGIVYSESDNTLHIQACGAEFRMTETAKQVTVISASYVYPPGAASCRAFDFALILHAPLGERPVIDGFTHEAVPVTKVTHLQTQLPQLPAPSLRA